MKTLTFITNIVNHHQLPLADEFYRILGDGYHFISTEPMPEWLIKGGYDSSLDRPYIIRAYESSEKLNLAKKLTDAADVVIMGQAKMSWIRKRLFYNKITFNFNERWFKDSDFSTYLKLGILGGIFKNHFIYRYHKLYMLCASAFTAEDVRKVGCYPGMKCFKWGYFTQVNTDLTIETAQKMSGGASKIISLMWCARFLKLKHPELPILLAQKLKKDGYKFVLEMFGSGEELEKTKLLAKQLGVEDVVKFRGNLPNQEILLEMQKHDIFLFTSDRNEGWGAVLNESMANGCAVVASNLIGSVPYLIKDGENGLIFQSENIESLYTKVKILLDDNQLRMKLSQNAQFTMRNEWSPQNAAMRFISLVKSIEENSNVFFINGPCSLA